MTRIKEVLLAGVLAIGLAFVFTPKVAHMQDVNCAGSFTPSFNCVVTGLWNFTNGLKTNSAIFQTYTVLLNNTQILALNTTPVTIIPLTPGYVAVPLYGVASFNYTSVYAAGGDLKLFYTSRVAGNAASGTITFAGFLDTAASNNSDFTGVVAGPEPGRTSKAVTIEQVSQTAMTGGSGANTLRIQVQAMLYPTGVLN